MKYDAVSPAVNIPPLARIHLLFIFVLATRYLERIADHATNIAEDTIFWVRDLDVRHGHMPPGTPPTAVNHSSGVMENSSSRDASETRPA